MNPIVPPWCCAASWSASAAMVDQIGEPKLVPTESNHPASDGMALEQLRPPPDAAASAETSGVVREWSPSPTWYQGVLKSWLGAPPVARPYWGSFQTCSPPYPTGTHEAAPVGVRLPSWHEGVLRNFTRPRLHVGADPHAAGELPLKYGFPWVPPTAVTHGEEEG